MRFRYVDIGTSDFDTSIDCLAPGEFGLYVEPLFSYLAKLPDGPGVVKAPFAVSDCNGYGVMHHVSETDIEQHSLPAYVRGCNSLNRPHQWLSGMLSEKVAFTCTTVPVITFERLLQIYSVESIDHLKIDTEGHDHVILKQVVDSVDLLGVNTIQFEYVETNDNVQELDELLAALRLLGFEGIQRDLDITLSRVA